MRASVVLQTVHGVRTDVLEESGCRLSERSRGTRSHSAQGILSLSFTKHFHFHLHDTRSMITTTQMPQLVDCRDGQPGLLGFTMLGFPSLWLVPYYYGTQKYKIAEREIKFKFDKFHCELHSGHNL